MGRLGAPPEGQWALQEGYELPKTPAFKQAILAVAIGKGKGNWNSKDGKQRFQKGAGEGGKGSKGKDGKGKGKGYPPKAFKGNCHNCGKSGTMPKIVQIHPVEDSGLPKNINTTTLGKVGRPKSLCV